MKKIAVVLFVVAMTVASAAVAAENYVTGGFEASGNVVVGAGWSRFNNQVNTEVVSDGDYITYPGVMGKYMDKAPVAKTNRFAFFVDGVELDLAKSFGENIRLRADLDFARTNSSGFVSPAFVLEQAYATANIPIGNGLEVLMGRFNAPIGFENVDIVDNSTISKSILIRALRPANLTGAKLYYEFSDAVDFHFYVVNSLYGDNSIKFKGMPGFGFRVGYNWGDAENESTVGLSGLFGPVTQPNLAATAPNTQYGNKRMMFGMDVDLNWWITSEFALGMEALYTYFQKDNKNVLLVGNNTYYLGGLLNLTYLFSDVWDGTLKYAFAKQSKLGTGADAGGNVLGNLTGAQQMIHEISLAGAYHVADGADVKLEGRFDIVKPTGAPKIYNYGLAMAFGYKF